MGRRGINIERGRCEERLKYEDRLAAGKKRRMSCWCPRLAGGSIVHELVLRGLV